MGGRSVVARVELIKTTIRIVREAKIKKRCDDSIDHVQ